MTDNFMTDFEKNNTERMFFYTENVKKISEYLHSKFYFQDQFDPYYDPEIAEISINECLDKAARLYQFFDDVEAIQKMMEFLNTVNPGFAKDLVNGL